MFHENGGKEIRTELVQTQLGQEIFFIFKAVVTGTKGTFEGYGDACRANVNPMIVKHLMRMAGTRAKAFEPPTRLRLSIRCSSAASRPNP